MFCTNFFFRFIASCYNFNIIINTTKEHNIELIFIPEGLTYKYQPLDVLINGILKQKSKRMWREEIIKDPNLKITNKDAVRHFSLAMKELTKYVIKRAFNL